MGKIYVWVGYFPTEQEFESYLDQSAFRQWWSDNDEDNLELSCQFCKEMGLGDYDEDFMVMKYNNTSCEINDIYGLIPASYDKLQATFIENDIKKVNSVIYYNTKEDISLSKAKKAKTVQFLGEFKFEDPTLAGGESLAGIKNMFWIGTIDSLEEEFMKYFDQSEYMKALKDFESGVSKKRPSTSLICGFCKDLKIKFYYPELLHIAFKDEVVDTKVLIKEVFKDEYLYDSVFENVDGLNMTKVNVVVLYNPNGLRDSKRNQKINIFCKRFIGRYDKPKNYMDELDSYNGLRYLGSFMWD